MKPFLPDYENALFGIAPMLCCVAEDAAFYTKSPEHISESKQLTLPHSIAGLQLTKHALKRLAQRQITAQMVADTIKHGLKLCKQGLCFYVLTERIAAKTFARPYAERIVNTVVIVKRPDYLITAYKNSRAVRSIQKKPKRLMR